MAVDDLHNLEMEGGFGGLRELNVERANKLKTLVDIHDIPLVATGEVRKRQPGEKKKKITTHDLMETSKICYNANLIWLLNPHSEDAFGDDDVVLELGFGKNKLSYYKGEILLRFQRTVGKMEEE